MAAPKKRKKNNYLNNKDLLAETIKSLEQEKMTDKLAHMLMLLVKRIASKSNFAGYTYNDEMQGYALMMLVRTWKGFNPEKSSNAFAFFTQCVKNSFIQYLNQERRQRDIRDALLVDNEMDPSYTYQEAYRQKVQDERNFADDEEDFEHHKSTHAKLTKAAKEQQTEDSDALVEY